MLAGSLVKSVVSAVASVAGRVIIMIMDDKDALHLYEKRTNDSVIDRGQVLLSNGQRITGYAEFPDKPLGYKGREKLDKQKCEESIDMARRFFEVYFSEHNYEYFFCESWLLFEGNRDFMAGDSNIVKFMGLFKDCYSMKIDVQAIERIYGKRKLIKKNYSENSDLQRRAKAYMLDGNKLGIGVAVIRK